MENDVLKRSQQAVEKEKISIQRNMEICERAAQIIVSTKDLVEFIDNKTDYSVEDTVQFNSVHVAGILRIQGVNIDVNRISVYTDNPGIPEIGRTILREERISKKEWWKQVVDLKGNIFWLFNHKEDYIYSLSNNKEMVSLFREIKNIKKEHSGVVEVSMQSEKFFGDHYDNSDNEESFFYFMVGDNDRYLKGDSWFLKKAGMDISSFKDLLVEKMSEKSGDFILDGNEVSMLVVYDYIEAAGIYIFQVTSNESLIKNLDRTRNIILVAVFGGIMVLTVVTYLIISILLKKMKLMIGYMRKVQEGDLGVVIPHLGNSEVGELAHHFRKMLVNVKELISVIVKKESMAKDAEIRTLQTQINAHFIYNVLESIKMMAEIQGNCQVSEAVTDLGNLLRYSLKWMGQYVSLKDEVEYIRKYINLINIRFDNEINIAFSIEEKLLYYKILKMTLQPIVENAVSHGLRPKRNKGVVRITAYPEGDILCIDITDDGIGIGPEELELLNRNIKSDYAAEELSGKTGGIGLKNVNERVKLYYGDRYGLEVTSERNKYTTVRMLLPLRKDETGDEANAKSIAGG